MPADPSEALLRTVMNYTIGFGRAGHTPSAMGSGVLVRFRDIYGILTCAHVDEYLRSLQQPVGRVRLNRGSVRQAGTLDLDSVFSYAAFADTWTAGQEDISFIHLPPHLLGDIQKHCSFLDWEQNFTKPGPADTTELIVVNSVFGLVEEFTGATTRQNGLATTVLRAVLTSGTIHESSPVSMTLECFRENIPDLPSSFGGNSGGGFWRAYMRKRGDDFEIVHLRLVGLASNEVKVSPPHIVCQGIARIQATLEEAHRQINGTERRERQIA